MSNGIVSSRNPLSYTGVDAPTPPNTFLERRAPTANDASSNYVVGSFWLNILTQNLYVLTSSVAGVANWQLLNTSGPAGAENFITDSGTAVESGGDIEILGDVTSIETSGSGNTVTVALAENPEITGTLTVDDGIDVTSGGLTVDGTITFSSLSTGVLQSNGIGVISSTAGTDGQVLIGDSAGAPAWAAITAGSNISVVNGANSITISTTGGGGGAMTFHTDGSDATVASGAITMNGGSNITTSGSGSTVTFDVSGTTNHSLLVGNASGSIDSLGVATNGQLPIGSTGANPTLATLTAGSGISITNGAGSITINSIGGGLTWNDTGVSTSVNMAAGNGYIANNAALVTLTLPASITEGQVIAVSGKGAGGWSIVENTGQTIHFGTSTTTTTSGSLSSTNQYDTVFILCITTDTDFVVQSAVGNLTVA